MDFNKIFNSRKFKIAVCIIASLILLMWVFKAGEFVGYRKASFSYRWAENYHRNFGGPKGGFFQDFDGQDFTNSHGVFGSILKIDGDTLIVKSQDNAEKTIILSAGTTIEIHMQDIKPADLKIDDRIAIIGSPNDQGQIEAKLIRVFR